MAPVESVCGFSKLLSIWSNIYNVEKIIVKMRKYSQFYGPNMGSTHKARVYETKVTEPKFTAYHLHTTSLERNGPRLLELWSGSIEVFIWGEYA